MKRVRRRCTASFSTIESIANEIGDRNDLEKGAKKTFQFGENGARFFSFEYDNATRVMLAYYNATD